MHRRKYYSIALLILASCGSVQYRGPEDIQSCQDAKRVSAPVMQTQPTQNIRVADVQRLVGHYNTCISELDKDTKTLAAEKSGDFWETTGKVAIAFLVGLIGGAAAAGH